MERYLIAEFDRFGREPILRRMPDDSLVCLALTGGPDEPHNENRTVISRSFDDGETWTQPETLFSHSRRGVWCTELFTEGPLPFIAVQTYNAESHYRELQTFLSFSPDGGTRWSSPASLPGGLTGMALRQGVVLSSGEWLFPVCRQETRDLFAWGLGGESESGRDFICGALISGDQGRSFLKTGYIRAETGLREPACIELEDGHVVMLMRDAAGGCLQVSESFDYGRSWSEAHPTVIPNPGSRPALIRARENVLLINNFTAGSDRTHLGVWVSNDMMRSWKRFPLAEEDALLSDPHGFADDKRETLYLAFENSRRHELLKIPYRELGI